MNPFHLIKILSLIVCVQLAVFTIEEERLYFSIFPDNKATVASYICVGHGKEGKDLSSFAGAPGDPAIAVLRKVESVLSGMGVEQSRSLYVDGAQTERINQNYNYLYRDNIRSKLPGVSARVVKTVYFGRLAVVYYVFGLSEGFPLWCMDFVAEDDDGIWLLAPGVTNLTLPYILLQIDPANGLANAPSPDMKHVSVGFDPWGHAIVGRDRRDDLMIYTEVRDDVPVSVSGYQGDDQFIVALKNMVHQYQEKEDDINALWSFREQAHDDVNRYDPLGWYGRDEIITHLAWRHDLTEDSSLMLVMYEGTPFFLRITMDPSAIHGYYMSRYISSDPISPLDIALFYDNQLGRILSWTE